ncbi:uncharacterized protein DMAD_11068 [Drosophila madeirensis]|uniref:Uncharacterized protein n=1 Tax=Drosophila madeirensis TaxID=30013 RepID=A0AAU9FC02_DROMD
MEELGDRRRMDERLGDRRLLGGLGERRLTGGRLGDRIGGRLGDRRFMGERLSDRRAADRRLLECGDPIRYLSRLSEILLVECAGLGLGQWRVDFRLDNHDWNCENDGAL